MKFGGTSVANSENMSKVVDIVSKAVERDRTILVSSAISGCTDTLIKIGIRASERDESYKTLTTSSTNFSRWKSMRNHARSAMPFSTHYVASLRESASSESFRQPALMPSRVSENYGLQRFWRQSLLQSALRPNGSIPATS